MPATITRTVTWTGTNTTSNPDFEWVNVDGVTWVTRADSSTVNQSDFTIADNNTGAVRTSQWEVRHWNYVNDNTLIDSFTITQSAAGVVATTQAPTTQAPDTYQLTFPNGDNNVSAPANAGGVSIMYLAQVNGGTGYTLTATPTSNQSWVTPSLTGSNQVTLAIGSNNTYSSRSATITLVHPQDSGTTATITVTQAGLAATTQAPVNYTLTLDSGTSSGQPLQIQEVGSPQAHTIGYTLSPAGAPQRVGNLPAWLTENIAGANQNSGNIQLQLNPNTATHPADSQSTTITYKHNGDSSNSSEVTIYMQFVAAPSNGILVTSTNVAALQVAQYGEGESTYTDDNSANSASQAVTYTLSLDPDTTLDSSDVYWSTSLPSTSGHQASPNPYWATVLTIDNTPSSGQAQISYSHVDPNAGGSMPNRNTPLTEEQAGTQTSGPGVILTNQRYVIARHPGDTSHWVAILVTAPSASITTTTTIPIYNFEFTSISPVALVGSGMVVASFNWNGPSSIDAQDSNGIYTYFSVENPTSPASSFIFNVNTSNGTVTATVNEGVNNSNGGDNLTIDFTPGVNEFLLDSASVTSINFAWAPCHVEGTVMNLADGTTKLVEDLQVGDVLASYDIAGLSDAGEWSNYSSQINQFSASSSTATVTSVIAGQHTTYRNFNNGLTKVTGEHPILVKTAGNDILFKQAADVLVGDSFYTASGWVEITSNEFVEETVNTYSIDVETEDVYMADGVLFHNNEVREKIE